MKRFILPVLVILLVVVIAVGGVPLVPLITGEYPSTYRDGYQFYYDSDDIHCVISGMVLDAVDENFPGEPVVSTSGPLRIFGGPLRTDHSLYAKVAGSEEIDSLVDRLTSKAKITGGLKGGSILPILDKSIREEAHEWVNQNRESLTKKYK